MSDRVEESQRAPAQPSEAAQEPTPRPSLQSPETMLGNVAQAIGPAVLQRKLARRRAGRSAGPGPAAAPERTAEAGFAAPAQPLPHLEQIQRSFGDAHDLSGVRAHVGGAAATASAALDAHGYALGDHVAFARAPDLHLAAHEAAHVVQQRGGVHLKGGVVEESDVYERHADAVADAVVADKSAEGLLDGMGGAASGGGVQRKVAEADAYTRDTLISTAQLAENLERGRDSQPHGRRASGAVRFRLPTAAAIKDTLTSGKVPEDKLKDSIALALTRMAKEGRLATKEPVPDIMKKLFPSPGKFDEKEFAKVVDTTDRTKVYKNVADAQTTISGSDKPKLSAAIDDAMKLIDKAMADSTGLTEVFGTKAAKAKGVYAAAKAAMGAAKGSMDAAIDTDYNRDDAETGLGGWADFGSQHIHLETAVAQVKDKDDTVITLIHECCHLASPDVDDHGYYGSKGFEAMSEDEKVGNAAHYEELPARYLGKSSYAGKTFTPGKTSSGGKVTFEDEVRRDASDYLRKAWDKAVDVHGFLREIREDIETGSRASFKAHTKRILEISKLYKLTVHTQRPTPSTINMNDVVLAEGVARAAVIIKRNVSKQPVPAAPVMPKAKKDYVGDVVSGSIKGYGALTGNDADDRVLIDWLVKEYRKPL